MGQPKAIDSHSVSIGEIFRKPVAYHVPHYQRDFAWTDEQVEILWEDIIASLTDRESNDYFLGAIVVAPGEDDKTRSIVDGQQRLAAISMLFSAIAAAWQEEGDERRATGISRDYLGTEDRRTGDIIPKLKLNETNSDVFKSVVLDRKTPSISDLKLWHPSKKRIHQAFEIIKKSLHKWLEGFKDKESALLDLEEFLADRLNVILIEVGDDSDAFVIFETLNDRGLALAVSDLVKNYLFSLAGSRDIETFKVQWHDISTVVGGQHLTQFLRHYWLSSFGLVRERDLYRELKHNIKNNTKARQFIERLHSASKLYAALENPEHDFWEDFPHEILDILKALSVFGVTQYRPVALAVVEKFKPDKAIKVFRQLMVISFRYTVVAKLGTGNLEKIYADAAMAVRNDEAPSPKEVFSKLRQAYVPDGVFSDRFASRRFTKSVIARYILADNYIEQSSEKKVAFESANITLEHVLPKNPGNDWRDAYTSNEEFEEIVEQIGNLTLLERGKNRGVANAAFDKKKKRAFLTSGLAINKEIATEKEWNAEKIRERSRKFAELACKIWKISY